MVAQLATVAAAQVQSDPLTAGPHAAFKPHPGATLALERAALGLTAWHIDQAKTMQKVVGKHWVLTVRCSM